MHAAIESFDARLLFLSPNSPDFNPIAQAFAKLRAHLRKAAEPTICCVWSAIGGILILYSPPDCTNYSADCGNNAD